MQIWLGKQYLGQRDLHSTELTGADQMPLIPDAVALELAARRAKVQAGKTVE